MTFHPDLLSGRWQTFSLAEQLGHVGSEISRALRAKEAGNVPRMTMALERALELLDSTIGDPRHRTRLKELCRTREVLCDFFFGENIYHSAGPSLDKYFTQFAQSARREREHQSA